MIRLIASDIDGTLLPEETSELDPVYFDLIHALAARGVRFAAASGRQYPNLRRLFAPVADEIDYICENGSLVVSRGRIISKTTLDRAKGEKLLRALLEIPGCEALLSGVETNYIQPKDPAYVDHLREQVKNNVTVVDDLAAVPEGFLKIAAHFKGGATEAIKERLRALAAPYLRPVVSGLSWIDFLLDGCNKGAALLTLLDTYQIPREQSAAFGDNENDLELIQQAGTGYAMRTGHPALRAAANRIVDNVAAELQAILEGQS